MGPIPEPAVERVGTTLATDPRDIDNRPKSGDLQSARYNFNIQPAMARPISSGESS